MDSLLIIVSLWVLFISSPIILYILYIYPVSEYCKFRGAGNHLSAIREEEGLNSSFTKQR